MSVLQNVFKDFIQLQAILPEEDLYEVRLENDPDGNTLYIGKTIIPDGSTSAEIWSIIKLSYDVNNFLVRKQLPDAGQGFNYAWDERATYFS